MIQDREHSAERCLGKINAFWRRLGANAEARIGRNGEIESRLTNGLPGVRLSTSDVVKATRASGALRRDK